MCVRRLRVCVLVPALSIALFSISMVSDPILHARHYVSQHLDCFTAGCFLFPALCCCAYPECVLFCRGFGCQLPEAFLVVLAVLQEAVGAVLLPWLLSQPVLDEDACEVRL